MKMWFTATVLAFVAILALHFGEELVRTGPPSPTWSRSVPVGETDLNLPPAIDPTPGGGAEVLWLSSTGAQLAQVTPAGQVKRTVSVPGLAGARKVVAGRPGTATFFWVGPQGVAGATFDPATGRPTASYRWPGGETVVTAVDRLVVTADPASVAVWRLENGIPVRQAVVPLPGVIELAAAKGPGGTLHLFLATRPNGASVGTSVKLWYAAVPPGTTTAEPAPLSLLLASHSTVSGLQAGLDRSHLYLLVNWQTVGQLGQRPQYEVRMAALPLSRPDSSAGAIVPPGGVTFRALRPPSLPGLRQLAGAALGRAGERGLEVAFRGGYVSSRGFDLQALTARLTPEGLREPEPATRSRGAVLDAQLLGQGPERRLFFLATAGFDRYRLQATGAGPLFRQYNRPTSADIMNALFTALLGIFAFFPAAFLISGTLIPAVAAVTLPHMVALTWTERHQAAVLGLGTAAYLLSKTLVLGRTFYGGPLKGLLPPWLAPLPVGLVLSTAFFALALWGVAGRARLRRRWSSFGDLIGLALVDLPLTLLLYGFYLR